MAVESSFVLLDVGDAERLRKAALLASQLIARKLLYGEAQERVGLWLGGAGELTELAESGRPALRHISALRALYAEPFETAQSRPELLVARVLESVRGNFGRLKGRKTIFMFTNGNWPRDAFDNCDEIERNIAAIDVYLNVIFIGEQTFENENALQKLKAIARERLEITDFATATDRLSALATRPNRLNCKFHGELELSPITRIAVNIHARTVRRGLPPTQLRGPKGEAVTRSQVHYSHEDPLMRPIAASRLGAAYRFGTEIVPLNGDAMAALHFKEPKCLRTIAFVEESQLPLWFGMSAVDCVSANAEDARHVAAFTALVDAMAARGVAMLARFTARDNGQPRLVALRPATEGEGRVLYLVELPTAEDTREFAAGAVRRATPRQLAAVARFVSELSIEGSDLLRPETTPNPTNQIVNQRLLERGIAGAECPPLDQSRVDSRVIELLFPERATAARAADLSTDLRANFDVEQPNVPAPPAVASWRELVCEKEERVKAESAARGARDVSEHCPVSDFREMLDNRREDLVTRAVQQMQTRIVEQLRRRTADFERTLECLLALREGCLREGEADAYNDFLEKLRCDQREMPQITALWRAARVSAQLFGPITNEESADSRVNVTSAARFVESFEKGNSVE